MGQPYFFVMAPPPPCQEVTSRFRGADNVGEGLLGEGKSSDCDVHRSTKVNDGWGVGGFPFIDFSDRHFTTLTRGVNSSLQLVPGRHRPRHV